MKIKKFLLQHEDELTEYFERLKVNQNKTEVRFGLSPINLSLVFYISGEHDNNISSFKEKINALFNTDSDLTEANNFIENLKEPYKFDNQNDFLKLKGNPLKFAFQVTVKKVK